jgi:hypothetical protein
VGHIVSSEGIATYPDKTNKVLQWPTRTSPEDFRKFLGFVGYYRKLMKDFGKIAQPLT